MKKVINILAFVLLGFISVQVQSQKKTHDVKYGVKGGLNISNIATSGDGSPSTTSYVNFHIGAFAEIKLNPKVSFQPEMLYSLQGAKFDQVVVVNGASYNTNDTFKFTYLNIPLMFKYYPNSKFFLESGPQVGFLTEARLEVNIPGVGSGENDVKSSFKTVDFGLNLGLGYNFSKKVVGNIRYNLGISNMLDTQSGDNSKAMNRVLQLSLGYIF
jgi:hypothetical protein